MKRKKYIVTFKYNFMSKKKPKVSEVYIKRNSESPEFKVPLSYYKIDRKNKKIKLTSNIYKWLRQKEIKRVDQLGFSAVQTG